MESKSNIIILILCFQSILIAGLLLFFLTNKNRADTAQARMFCIGDVLLRDEDIISDNLGDGVMEEKFKNARKECVKRYPVH